MAFSCSGSGAGRRRNPRAELLGPGDQRAVAGDLVVLDGLRGSDERGIEHLLVVDVAGDFLASSMMPSIAGQVTPFGSGRASGRPARAA